MNNSVNNALNQLHKSLLALLEDIQYSRYNPDQCMFDYKVQSYEHSDFSKYIFTRKKDEAQIAFVIVYDKAECAFSHLTIDENTLPSVFLNSDLITRDLVKICDIIDEIVAEQKLNQSISFVMPLLEEFFEDCFEEVE